MESQSDDQPFWLVRLVKKHPVLVGDQVWEEWGANIVCKSGAKAVEVTELNGGLNKRNKHAPAWWC